MASKRLKKAKRAKKIMMLGKDLAKALVRAIELMEEED